MPYKDYEKQKQHSHDTYWKNREERLLQAKEYYYKNWEKKQEYRKEWLEENHEYMREFKNKYNQKYRTQNKEKCSAHDKVKWAIKTGKLIKPEICSSCNNKFSKRYIVGHHTDYAKPLDVIWMCGTCHRKEHNEQINELS